MYVLYVYLIQNEIERISDDFVFIFCLSIQLLEGKKEAEESVQTFFFLLLFICKTDRLIKIFYVNLCM